MTLPDDTTPADDRLAERNLAVAVLIACAVGLGLGRMVGSEYLLEPSIHKADAKSPAPRPAWPEKRPEPFPTYGSNDRSRWATIRALVERGEFKIGERKTLDEPGPDGKKYKDSGIVFEPGYMTVDKVMNPETLEFYSTKPPLLTVMAAGECWVLNQALGWRVHEDRWLVVRAVTITFNLLPLVLYLWLMADLARRFSKEAFTLYFVVAAAAFGGMIWPFLVTFNNHVPGTVAAALALWAALRMAMEDEPPAWMFAICGLACGFAFSCELPALSLLAALFVYSLWRSPKWALLLFLPLAALPEASQEAVNYIALKRLTPAYAEFDGPWYTYEGSHWLPPGKSKPGIDYAQRHHGETKATYALHLFVGHHGFFSLMPIWLLTLPGFVIGLMRLRDEDRTRRAWALASLLCLLVSAAVFAFYLYKTENYGGWTNGPRWLMWLAPLWLVTMFPVLDWLGKSRLGVAFALLLLVFSAMSMNFHPWSPWRHPWIHELIYSGGLVPY
jgi:hypothetical protein